MAQTLTNLIIGFLILSTLSTRAQDRDSLVTKELHEVTIKAERVADLERLPSIKGTRMYTGKKNEVISLQGLDANIAEKTPRQIFAKVPGVFVYDMDGSGNQVNISTRGLDPHRGWEFNIRRDEAITNSDMYGYPASHFSMPMEAVERIELVRGTGSLQYGAQFGGMLNYVTKAPDTSRVFSFESINTAGSFGLLSTYNAVGGTSGKFSYYAYVNRRVLDGYRDDNASEASAEAGLITYRPSDRVNINLQLSHSKYIHQLAGALNDQQFKDNPRQSTRSRNYYSPDIYIPSLNVEWKIGSNTTASVLSSWVLGSRESVMFDKPADVHDVIDPVTLQYAPRQVDIDKYRSHSTELRLLHRYTIGGIEGTLVMGAQLMRNELRRYQQGKGTTGSDFDLTLTEPGWGRELNFKTNNVAAFAETALGVSDRLSITPGVRFESGKSDLTGSVTYYPDEELPTDITHNFFLAGVNLEYRTSARNNFYAGFSQSYRPVILKDIVPSSVYERVDDNLKDADGYNLEAGFRGTSSNLRWDIGVFQTRYNNKLGMLTESDGRGSYTYIRTNIGDALTRGVEAFVEWYLPLSWQHGSVSLFTSTAFMDARYNGASIRSGNENINIDGNKVESTPELISRNGLNFNFRAGSISLLYSYTADSFADALNTRKPSTNGAVGVVPAYSLFDINSTWRITASVKVRVNINNVFDEKYFTKRPQFYPGPGIWPSDGRSVVITAGIRL